MDEETRESRFAAELQGMIEEETGEIEEVAAIQDETEEEVTVVDDTEEVVVEETPAEPLTETEAEIVVDSDISDSEEDDLTDQIIAELDRTTAAAEELEVLRTAYDVLNAKHEKLLARVSALIFKDRAVVKDDEIEEEEEVTSDSPNEEFVEAKEIEDLNLRG